jgi:hypothetical protein
MMSTPRIIALVGIVVCLALSVAYAQPTGSNTAPNKVPVTTFANLPACNSGNEGLRWGISDATAPTSLSNAAGGGAVHVAVYCNSANWIVQ